MGRYLDLARDAKAAGNCGKEAISSLQWEEQSQCRFWAGKGYEINEIYEISPPSQDYEINEKRSVGGAPLCPPGGRAVLLQVPDGVPTDWVQGIANVLAMPPHPDWPEAGWKTLQEDGLVFLREWAAQAHALGWDALDLFGVRADAPSCRLDCMGLVPLLGGRPVVAITEMIAAINAASGGTLVYRRRNAWPGGCCPIWELKTSLQPNEKEAQ
jgi:hypothetical protein